MSHAAGTFDISTDGEAAKPDTSDFFPAALKALRHIMERSSAKVVLCAEWRRSEVLLKALEDIFNKNRLRLWSDITTQEFKLEKGSDPLRSFADRRSKEISAWLRKHEGEVSGWVVLDDINLSMVDESQVKKTATKPMPMGPHHALLSKSFQVCRFRVLCQTAASYCERRRLALVRAEMAVLAQRLNKRTARHRLAASLVLLVFQVACGIEPARNGFMATAHPWQSDWLPIVWDRAPVDRETRNRQNTTFRLELRLEVTYWTARHKDLQKQVRAMRAEIADFDNEIKRHEALWPRAADIASELEACRSRIESLLHLRLLLLEDCQRLPLAQLAASAEVEVSNANSIAPSSDTSADGRASSPENEKEAQVDSDPSFPEAAFANTAASFADGTCYGDPGAAEQPMRVADPEGPENMAGMASSTDMPAYVDIADLYWNVGSNGHALGACRPCNFFHGSAGCSRGRSCKFCHLCPRGRAKQRRMKLKRGLRNAGQLEDKILEQQETAFELGLCVSAERQRLLRAHEEAKDVHKLMLSAEKEYQDEMYDAAMRDFHRKQAKVLERDAMQIRETAAKLHFKNCERVVHFKIRLTSCCPEQGTSQDEEDTGNAGVDGSTFLATEEAERRVKNSLDFVLFPLSRYVHENMRLPQLTGRTDRTETCTEVAVRASPNPFSWEVLEDEPKVQRTCIGRSFRSTEYEILHTGGFVRLCTERGRVYWLAQNEHDHRLPDWKLHFSVHIGDVPRAWNVLSELFLSQACDFGMKAVAGEALDSWPDEQRGRELTVYIFQDHPAYKGGGPMMGYCPGFEHNFWLGPEFERDSAFWLNFVVLAESQLKAVAFSYRFFISAS
ncbi:unnamed protein product [Symbiodinium sp. CCMP2592]|nr:unnamed protein product [Symbiodinium sp. CCMP2592]